MIPLTALGESFGIASPLVCKVVRDPNQDSQWFPRVLLAEAVPSGAEQRSSISAFICERQLTRDDLSQLGNLPTVHGLSASHLRVLGRKGAVKVWQRRAFGLSHPALFVLLLYVFACSLEISHESG